MTIFSYHLPASKLYISHEKWKQNSFLIFEITQSTQLISKSIFLVEQKKMKWNQLSELNRKSSELRWRAKLLFPIHQINKFIDSLKKFHILNLSTEFTLNIPLKVEWETWRQCYLCIWQFLWIKEYHTNIPMNKGI